MNDVTITTTTVADTPSNGATGNRAQLTSLGFAHGHMCSGNLSGCKCAMRLTTSHMETALDFEQTGKKSCRISTRELALHLRAIHHSDHTISVGRDVVPAKLIGIRRLHRDSARVGIAFTVSLCARPKPNAFPSRKEQRQAAKAILRPGSHDQCVRITNRTQTGPCEMHDLASGSL